MVGNKYAVVYASNDVNVLRAIAHGCAEMVESNIIPCVVTLNMESAQNMTVKGTSFTDTYLGHYSGVPIVLVVGQKEGIRLIGEQDDKKKVLLNR